MRTGHEYRALVDQLVGRLRQRGAPATWTWIGGGLEVIDIAGEDPAEYVWLGTCETEIGDGPWINDLAVPEMRRWAGGYRYRGERCTDCVMVPVAGPHDLDAVADAMIQAWRRLMELPVDQSV